MLNSFFGNIKIYEFVFSTISWYWDGTATWNSSPWNRGTCLSCIINTMDADGPTIQGARASAAVILTSLCRNIPVEAPKELTLPMWCGKWHILCEICQHHACWCPGAYRRQVISRHDVGYVIKTGSVPPSRWIISTCIIQITIKPLI